MQNASDDRRKLLSVVNSNVKKNKKRSVGF